MKLFIPQAEINESLKANYCFLTERVQDTNGRNWFLYMQAEVATGRLASASLWSPWECFVTSSKLALKALYTVFTKR